MNCPICGVNIPRFIACIIAGFAFIFGFDFIVHQNLLMDLYEQTKTLWRPEEAMAEYFPLMIVHNVLLVTILVFIFTRNYEGKGLGEGLRFGAALGTLLALMNASSYIWMPIPLELAAGWAASGFITALTLGIIFSFIYRK